MPDIRHDDSGAIDEVVARGADVHIERMSTHGWFVCITETDGAELRLWLGSRNGRAAVDVRLAEATGAGPARDYERG